MIFSFGEILKFPKNLFLVAVTLLLFLNGSTDAANAVATVVGTKTLSIKKAVLLSSIFNFFGTVIMCEFSIKVANSVYNLASFGTNEKIKLLCLFCAVISVVLWAWVTWIFGIPTSESHALLSALSGGSLAVFGNFSGLNFNEWSKTLIGLILSILIAFFLGFIFERLIKKIKHKKYEKNLKVTQVAFSIVTSFLHGAQDGQKFAIVLTLGVSANGFSEKTIPFYISAFCGLFIAIGTLVGGKKIIKNVGENITKMDIKSGIASELSSAVSLSILTLFGVAVSTTQIKTASILGVGINRDKQNVNYKLFFDMLISWILTFPGCAALGYILTKIFIAI